MSKTEYDSKVARRWVVAVAALGVLVVVAIVLALIGVVTPWLIWPACIWFLVGVLCGLLYVLRCILP